MDQPTVQYVKTRDGQRIAYTVSGSGVPFVFMPAVSSHAELYWRMPWGSTIYQALAERFRLVTFDRRGQGCSSRGLGSSHSYEDYLLDLEALVDHLQLGSFVLDGSVFSGHCAIRYAAEYPGRVRALILRNVLLSYEDQRSLLWDFAGESWDRFLETHLRTFGGLSGISALEAKQYLSESVDQADWIAMARAVCNSSVSSLLSNIKAPTLVMATRSQSQILADGPSLAAAIPHSQMAVFEHETPWVADDGNPSRLGIILKFLDQILQPEADGEASQVQDFDGLSSRELEVLRLITAGKTNSQIASDLVISRNTVARHVSHILNKIGAANRLEAAAYAYRKNVV